MPVGRAGVRVLGLRLISYCPWEEGCDGMCEFIMPAKSLCNSISNDS